MVAYALIACGSIVLSPPSNGPASLARLEGDPVGLSVDCAVATECGLGDPGRCVDTAAWFEVDHADDDAGNPVAVAIRLVAEPVGLGAGTWFATAGDPEDCASALLLSFEVAEAASAPTTEISPSVEVAP